MKMKGFLLVNVGVFVLLTSIFTWLVGLTMGHQEKRIEVETGRNTLETRQAIERERLATDEMMLRRRLEAESESQREYIKSAKERERRLIDAEAARQKAYIEAQKELAAQQLRQKCLLENRRYCMY